MILRLIYEFLVTITRIKDEADSTNQTSVRNRSRNLDVGGRLDVNYEILTDVAIPQVPIVGMTIKTAPELKELHWLGLGPYDAYPNKKAAPILGVWGGEAGSPEKGRQADESVPQMRTDTGVPFVGGFSILLNADLQKK